MKKNNPDLLVARQGSGYVCMHTSQARCEKKRSVCENKVQIAQICPITQFSLTRLPSCLQCKHKLGASWNIPCARISNYNHVHMSNNNSELLIKICYNTRGDTHAIVLLH